jgi:hypothetical protein
MNANTVILAFGRSVGAKGPGKKVKIAERSHFLADLREKRAENEANTKPIERENEANPRFFRL